MNSDLYSGISSTTSDSSGKSLATWESFPLSNFSNNECAKNFLNTLSSLNTYKSVV
jgi:hypothetical protein